MHPRRSRAAPAAWLPTAALCSLFLGDSVLLSEGFIPGAPALLPRAKSCSLSLCTPPVVSACRQVRGVGALDLLGLRAAGDVPDGGFDAFFAQQKKLAKQGKAGGLAEGDVVTNEGKSWTVTDVLRREGAVRSYAAVEEGSRERVLVKVGARTEYN